MNLTNTGTREFRGKYAQQAYVIDAGEIRVVPWEAMCHWLGDPTARDGQRVGDGSDAGTKVINRRSDELRRLKILYGIFDDKEIDRLEADQWELQGPFLEAANIHGERIITVIDDPDGKAVTPVDTTREDKDLLEGQIDSLKRELAALTANLARQNTDPEYVPTADVGDIDEDIPSKIPVSASSPFGRRGRER